MAEELPPPTISVVAPTYRRRARLARFVDAVLSDPGVHELVMAVDGGEDGSVEWLRERASTDPRLVVLDLLNGGSAAARQAGIEAASGEVVLLLDDDVIAGERLATRHGEHHRDGARRLVLGYMPNDWASRPRGLRGVAYLYRRSYEAQCERYEREPEFVLLGLWAGNLSMRRRDLLEVGIANEMAAKGVEDREFGIRCFKAGLEGRFDRTLRAEHVLERTLEQYRGDCFQAGRNRRELMALHPAELDEGFSLGQGLPRWARERCRCSRANRSSVALRRC